MDEIKRINKTVEMSGEQVDIIMTEMVRPASREQLDAMDPETRAHYKYLPPLNPRTYIAEEGIECMQDVPVKMRDGITIYVDMYKPVKSDRSHVVL